MKSTAAALLLLFFSPIAGEAAFSVPCGEAEGDGPSYLDPSFPGWERVAPRPLLLTETPRIYPTDPEPSAVPPEGSVRSVHAGGRIYLLLEWSDDTPERDRPPHPPGPELIKEGLAHPEGLEVFADAASCQVPQRPSPVYPSVMMGSRDAPVRLAFWKAGLGVSGHRGEGREKVERDEDYAARGDGLHADGRWRVAFQLPRDPAFEGTLPVSFAIWGGSRLHRNGRKFFTPWYDLELR